MRFTCMAWLALLAASSASAQTVGLYADPQGLQCGINTTNGQSTTAYVIYLPAGNPAGISSVHTTIQVTGNTVGLSMQATPTPLAYQVQGDPFSAAGGSLSVLFCNITTPTVLYTVTLSRTLPGTGPISVTTTASGTTCFNSTPFSSAVTGALDLPAPAVPSSPDPADGAVDVTSHQMDGGLTLAWQGVIPPSVCGTDAHYTLYLGTDPNPPAVVNVQGAGAIVNPWEYNTTYYWRVDAVVTGPYAAVAHGPLWRFTTGAPPPPPPPMETCPQTCETTPPACPITCLFTQDAALPDVCSNEVSASHSTGVQCVPGLGVGGFAWFDRSIGTMHASAAASIECGQVSIDVICADRFHLEGPAAMQPIAFSANVHFVGSPFMLGALGEGTGPATFRAVGPGFPTQGDLVLPLSHLPGEDFILRYGVDVSAYGAKDPDTEDADGRLTFTMLPEGYRITSCEGFGGFVRATPASWSRVKSMYRE